MSDRSARLRVVCVGHALKESLTVRESRHAVERGVVAAGGEVAGSLCISDGGDGFLDAISEIVPTEKIQTKATGPLGNSVKSEYLYDAKSRTAFIEIAQCSGLQLVPLDKRDPIKSGTAGVGDLLAAAVERGAARVFVGLGGSATTDGGIGLIARAVDRLIANRISPPKSADDLSNNDVARFLPQLRERLKTVELIGCTDVESPLCGPNGSAALFAPQKGATPTQVELLDHILARWADDVERALGESFRESPGAGAAGGLGFAMVALGGRLRSGADELCDLAGYDDRLKNADAVITSEGRFDRTSLKGKAPWRIARRAREHSCAVGIVCGSADSESGAIAEKQGILIQAFAESFPPAERAAHAARQVTEAAIKVIGRLRVRGL